MVNEEGVNSLFMKSADFSDIGTYVCFARNRAGESSFTVNLNVVGKFKNIFLSFSLFQKFSIFLYRFIIFFFYFTLKR